MFSKKKLFQCLFKFLLNCSLSICLLKLHELGSQLPNKNTYIRKSKQRLALSQCQAPVKRDRLFDYNMQHLSDIQLHIVACCWVFAWSNALNILQRHLFQTKCSPQKQKKCIVAQHLLMQHFLSGSNFL